MLLRTPSPFRRLWVGQFVSTIGDGMQRLALLWWALPARRQRPVARHRALHHDPRPSPSRRSGDGWPITWTVGGCSSRPTWCGWCRRRSWHSSSPPIGHRSSPWAPRSSSRRSLPAVFDPSYSAAVPTVVATEDLPAANGLNMANSAVGCLVGPLAAGGLISAAGLGWVLAVNAVSFAWSAAVIASCGCRARPRPTVTHLVSVSGDRSTPCDPSPDSDASSAWPRRSTWSWHRPVFLAALAVSRLDTGPLGFGLLQVLLGVGLLAGFRRCRCARHRSTRVAVRGAGRRPGPRRRAARRGCGVCARRRRGCRGDRQHRGDGAAPAWRARRGTGPGVRRAGVRLEGLRPLGLVLAAPLLAGVGVSAAFVVVGMSVTLVSLGLARGLVVEGGSTRRETVRVETSASGLHADDAHVGRVGERVVGPEGPVRLTARPSTAPIPGGTCEPRRGRRTWCPDGRRW